MRVWGKPTSELANVPRFFSHKLLQQEKRAKFLKARGTKSVGLQQPTSPASADEEVPRAPVVIQAYGGSADSRNNNLSLAGEEVALPDRPV